jgi:hypothetical protein
VSSTDRRIWTKGTHTLGRLGLTLAALLGVAACGSAECNDPCDGSSDCVGGYACVAVGTESNTVCLPEACEDCLPRACAVTAPVDGECSFRTCM